MHINLLGYVIKTSEIKIARQSKRERVYVHGIKKRKYSVVIVIGDNYYERIRNQCLRSNTAENS